MARVIAATVLLIECVIGRAATLSWTGLGPVNNWSRPENWSPSGPPRSLDSLVFPFGGANAYNDMVGLNLQSISFGGTGNPHIFGNTVGLIGGITDNCIGEAWVDLPLQFVGGPPTFTVNGTNAMKVTREISGGSGIGLRKIGNGTLTFSGNNTYSGPTYVELGTLAVGYDSALGSAVSGTTVFGGGTLRFAPGVTCSEPITLGGRGDGTNGALRATGTVTISSSVTITNGAVINVDPVGILLINGPIDGSGPLTKAGTGRLVLAGNTPNTYSGDTVIADGTLDLTKGSMVIAVPGNLVIGPAGANSPLAVARWNEAGVFGGNSVTVNANGFLDLNGRNARLSALMLNDGGDVQTGGGILSFTAGTRIQVGSQSLLGSIVGSSISGIIQLPANNNLYFDVAPFGPSVPPGLTPELDVPAIIAGTADNPNLKPASFQKLGTGSMRISGNNGAFGGSTVVNAGTLVVAGPGALGSTNGVTSVNSSAQIALEGNITINNETVALNSTRIPALENRSGNNVWSGIVGLVGNSSIGVSGGSLLLSGVVNGNGSLTKVGAGTLTLGGTANNSHLGHTYVHEGTLVLGKAASLQSVPHDLIVGSGLAGAPAAVARHGNQDQVGENIVVNETGLLDLNGWDEYAGNLVLNSGGDVQTFTGALYVLGTNGVTVNPGADTTSTISGRLGFDIGNRTITVGNGATTPGVFDLDISAVIFQANPTVNLIKAGPGRARFGGANTYTGTTTLSDGTLEIDGSQPQGAVSLNGRLQGVGTVGNITYSPSPAAVMAPGSGDGRGILSCANLNGNVNGRGFLEIELNGLIPGSQHDQVSVHGTVNLNGITLRASLGFASSPGDSFVIIDNDHSEAVTGTFRGLAQNGLLHIGEELFRINYAGGTGNDVVLTRLVTPPAPTLTIEPVFPQSVRLAWPTNSPYYVLQASTDLYSAGWSLVAPSPIVIAGNYVVTNLATNLVKSYRLFSP